jgi:septum formation protein
MLLERLVVGFEVLAPGTPETHISGEPAGKRASRLAFEKARAIATRQPDAIVIGSDQVACAGNAVLDKPGDAERCRRQLGALSGERAEFLTACAVLPAAPGAPLVHLDRTTVVFRHLADAEIDRYVAAERPFDCAGGFKAEGLGIALFERIESEDPTALIGLPLIWLAKALRQAGLAIP